VQVARAGRDREEHFYLPAGLLRERGLSTPATVRWNAGTAAGMDLPKLRLYERRRLARLP
jgi:hypothetical protein